MEECTDQDKQKKIFTFGERGMKLTLINTDRVVSEKITVDGCAITDNVPKCDYLHKAKDVERYIELKGKDIKRGLEQIKNTIEILSEDKRRKPKISYIICSQSPAATTSRMKLQKELKEKYNSRLIIKESGYEESY